MFTQEKIKDLVLDYRKNRELVMETNNEYIERTYLPIFGAIAKENQEKKELRSMYDGYLENISEYYYKNIRLPQNKTEAREHNNYLGFKNFHNRTWTKMTEYDKRIQLISRNIDVMIEDVKENSKISAYELAKEASQFISLYTGNDFVPCCSVLYDENHKTKISLNIIDKSIYEMIKENNSQIYNNYELFDILHTQCSNLNIPCLFFQRTDEIEKLCKTGDFVYITSTDDINIQNLLINLAQISNDPIKLEDGSTKEEIKEFLNNFNVQIDYGFLGGDFDVYENQVKFADLGGKLNSEDTILDERLFFGNPMNEEYRRFRWPFKRQGINKLINDFATISLNENLKQKTLQELQTLDNKEKEQYMQL